MQDLQFRLTPYHSYMACLANKYAIVFKHYRCFNYRPQFHNQQSPHPVINSRRTVRRRHYQPRIKSQRNLACRLWESNPQPSEQLRPMTIKTSAFANSAIVVYSVWSIRCIVVVTFTLTYQVRNVFIRSAGFTAPRGYCCCPIPLVEDGRNKCTAKAHNVYSSLLIY